MIWLRTTKRRFLYMGLMAAAGLMAIPFLLLRWNAWMGRSRTTRSTGRPRIAVGNGPGNRFRGAPVRRWLRGLSRWPRSATRPRPPRPPQARPRLKRIVEDERAYHQQSYFEMLASRAGRAFPLDMADRHFWYGAPASSLEELHGRRASSGRRRSPPCSRRASSTWSVGLFGWDFAFQPFIGMDRLGATGERHSAPRKRSRPGLARRSLRARGHAAPKEPARLSPRGPAPEAF